MSKSDDTPRSIPAESNDAGLPAGIFTDPDYAPEPVPTLRGGDGEGLYVNPRRYVEIEIGAEGGVRLTASAARQMAHELIVAADRIEVEL